MGTNFRNCCPQDIEIHVEIGCGSVGLVGQRVSARANIESCGWNSTSTPTSLDSEKRFVRTEPKRASFRMCPVRTKVRWWALKDLNLRPTDYESAALTAELRARDFIID